jgi:hypothetical protein
VVEIRVVGDEQALAEVRATAVELFARLDVRLRVLGDSEPSPTPGEPAPLVLAYVDLREPTSPRVDVEDGRTRQELMRRNLPDVSSLETAVEAAVHVVLASAESLLQLERAKRAEPAPAPRKRPAPSRPRRGSGLDVGALVRAVTFGDSRLTPGAGAALELRTDAGPVQAELGLWGAVHTATELHFDQGRASLRPYTLRLLPGVSTRLSRSLIGSLAVGAGLDHLRVSAQSAPSNGTTTDHALFDPILSSQLGLRFPLGGAWFLSLLGSVDLDLAPTRFSIERGGAREPLKTLPRLRGGLTLMASLSATSIERFVRPGEPP